MIKFRISAIMIFTMLLVFSFYVSIAKSDDSKNMDLNEVLTYTLPNGILFKMIATPDIPINNTFPTGTNDSDSSNVPARFFMGETEVTYELWYKVYKWATTNVGGGKREDGGGLYKFANAGIEGSNGKVGAKPTSAKREPVTKVNWRDSIVWCNALTEYYNANNGTKAVLICVYTYNGSIIRDSTNSNALACDNTIQNLTAKGFRLPTSNEWEFVARYRGTDTTNAVAGSDGTYYTKGNSASGDTQACNASTPTLGDYSVYRLNSDKTSIVKTKKPNALGVYDMSGNVWEWCFDWHPDFVGKYRVIRGGTYFYAENIIQLGEVSCGDQFSEGEEMDDYGFRFCRTR